MTIDVAPLAIPMPSGPILRGERWGGGANVAVLVHAAGEDLDAWGDLPAHLVGQGLAAIAFDLPGHGLSDGAWEPGLLVGSIRAVTLHARSAGAVRVFLVAAGASVLGALRAGAAGDVDALVGLSPPDLRNERSLPEVRAATLPKLLLVGGGEETAVAAARRLVRRCVGWTVLSTLPTGEQGTSLAVGPRGAPAREQIAGFLRDYWASGMSVRSPGSAGTGAGWA